MKLTLNRWKKYCHLRAVTSAACGEETVTGSSCRSSAHCSIDLHYWRNLFMTVQSHPRVGDSANGRAGSHQPSIWLLCGVSWFSIKDFFLFHCDKIWNLQVLKILISYLLSFWKSPSWTDGDGQALNEQGTGHTQMLHCCQALHMGSFRSSFHLD